MSEMLYAFLLRLYPQSFQQTYGEEVLRLFRDRLRDETGFLRRLQLWAELIFDLVMSLPREHHRTRTAVIGASPLLASNSVLQFHLLEGKDIPGPRAFLGAVVIAIVAFGFLMIGAMLGGGVANYARSGTSAPR